jgi:hypothetical protein
MITLPDFSKCIEFVRLRQKMGAFTIPVLPRVQFTREIVTEKKITEPDIEDRKLENQLKTDSVTTYLEEVSVSKQGLLTYKGRKVAAYIRDQRMGINYYTKTSTYRYHLCDCSTLHAMRAAGREKRYFVTKRKDGWFKVNDLSGWKPRKLEAKLELCQNCIHELRMRHLYFTPFSLADYFDKHESYVPKTITRYETHKRIQTYTPEQEDISREYKKAAKHSCQCCGVNCASDPSLLNLHHVDGDPSNNNHDNLRVLCIDCHSKQPYHEGLARPTEKQHQIKKIAILRAQQKIPSLGIAL